MFELCTTATIFLPREPCSFTLTQAVEVVFKTGGTPSYATVTCPLVLNITCLNVGKYHQVRSMQVQMEKKCKCTKCYIGNLQAHRLILCVRMHVASVLCVHIQYSSEAT